MHVCGQSNMHIVHLQQHYGIEERKTSISSENEKGKVFEKFSFVDFHHHNHWCGGEDDDFNDNDASGQGELPARGAHLFQPAGLAGL